MPYFVPERCVQPGNEDINSSIGGVRGWRFVALLVVVYNFYDGARVQYLQVLTNTKTTLETFATELTKFWEPLTENIVESRSDRKRRGKTMFELFRMFAGSRGRCYNNVNNSQTERKLKHAGWLEVNPPVEFAPGPI